MEDLDNETIEELKAKAIERGGDEVEEITTNEIDEELKDYGGDKEPQTIVEEPLPQEVKKPKRQRSEKQKAAFEKARLKRAENLKIKKQIEAEKKQKQKEEKEQVKLEVKKRLEKKETLVSSVPQEVNHISQRYKEVEEQPRYREQIVNNYYYYGTPPPNVYHEEPKPKRGRKKKVKTPPPPPEPEPYYSSESESEAEEEIIYSDPEEPQSYKELQNYVEERQPTPKQNNGLKFRFA